VAIGITSVVIAILGTATTSGIARDSGTATGTLAITAEPQPSSTATAVDADGCAIVPLSPAAHIGGVATACAGAAGKFVGAAATGGLSFS
jgi:predicted RNA methylase